MCEAGSVYDDYNRVNDFKGWWYLNVEIPAPCAGRVTEYKFEYYNPQGGDGTYRANVAMWEPVNDTAYTQVHTLSTYWVKSLINNFNHRLAIVITN